MAKTEHKTSIKRISNERFYDKPTGFIAALAVHGALFFALTAVFQWNTEPETFYAELWAPEDASGLDVKAKAAPIHEQAPEAKPEVQPEKSIQEELQAEREAEIKLAEKKRLQEERAKLEEKKKLEQRQRELEKKRLAQEAKRREEIRKQELARILGAPTVKEGQLAGSTKGDPRAAQQNLTGSMLANYNAQVIACIRPHITYAVPAHVKRGQHQAVYNIRLLPNGEQVGNPQKIKSSELAAYDQSVERAIRLCNPFPRPKNGQALPRQMTITFDPIDDKQ